MKQSNVPGFASRPNLHFCLNCSWESDERDASLFHGLDVITEFLPSIPRGSGLPHRCSMFKCFSPPLSFSHSLSFASSQGNANADASTPLHPPPALVYFKYLLPHVGRQCLGQAESGKEVEWMDPVHTLCELSLDTLLCSFTLSNPFNVFLMQYRAHTTPSGFMISPENVMSLHAKNSLLVGFIYK